MTLAAGAVEGLALGSVASVGGERSARQLMLWKTSPGVRAVVSVGAIGMRGASAPWRARVDSITLDGAK